MHIAVTLFGEVPRAVFTGDDAPRHSQRRVTPTAAELRLLKEVSLSVEAQGEPAVEACGGAIAVTAIPSAPPDQPSDRRVAHAGRLVAAVHA
jgi:hypothetical protein